MAGAVALIVEDAPEYAALGREVLGREQFEVHIAVDGETGVQMARELAPDFILIDINLPGIDGFEVCNTIREFSDAYILMVTTRDDEIEKVVGFRSGADDYVTKPYSPTVLSARIRAMQRRPRAVAPASPVRTFGRLQINLDARTTIVDGEEAPLTKIEFSLLTLLTDEPDKAITRAQMMERVWGSTVGDDHLIEVHVANLRRKLGQPSSRRGWVRTVRGIGYRFDPSAT